MTSKQWQARLEGLEKKAVTIEILMSHLGINSAITNVPIHVQRNRYEKQWEKLNQDILSCITAIVIAKKREKIRKAGTKNNQSALMERKIGDIV